MWGFLIGLYLAMMIYPFLEEWQQHQADNRRLAKMREHHAKAVAGTRPKGNRWMNRGAELSCPNGASARKRSGAGAPNDPETAQAVAQNHHQTLKHYANLESF